MYNLPNPRRLCLRGFFIRPCRPPIIVALQFPTFSSANCAAAIYYPVNNSELISELLERKIFKENFISLATISVLNPYYN